MSQDRTLPVLRSAYDGEVVSPDGYTIHPDYHQRVVDDAARAAMRALDEQNRSRRGSFFRWVGFIGILSSVGAGVYLNEVIKDYVRDLVRTDAQRGVIAGLATELEISGVENKLAIMDVQGGFDESQADALVAQLDRLNERYRDALEIEADGAQELGPRLAGLYGDVTDRLFNASRPDLILRVGEIGPDLIEQDREFSIYYANSVGYVLLDHPQLPFAADESAGELAAFQVKYDEALPLLRRYDYMNDYHFFELMRLPCQGPTRFSQSEVR